MANTAVVNDYLAKLQSNESQYRSRAVAYQTKSHAPQPKAPSPNTIPSVKGQPVLKVPNVAPPATVAPTGLLGKITTYAKAAVTAPGGLIKDIRTDQPIRAVDNGALVVNRMPFQASEAQKVADGKTGPNYKLDHTQSLEIGGDNNPKNLNDVPTAQWASYTPVEDFLGGQLKANKINAQQAKQLMNNFKTGKVSAQDTIAQAQKMPKGESLLDKVKGVAKPIEKADTAILKPIADLQDHQGGKTAHDIAQLSQDVSGGSANTTAKAIEETPKAVVREVQNKPVGDIQKKVFGTTSSGNIAKKIGASTAGNISLLAGGGEGKVALEGGEAAVKRGIFKVLPTTVKSAIKLGTAGATGNVSQTELKNPSASKSDLKKNAALGFAAGAVLPVAGKAVEQAIQTKAAQSVLDKLRAPKALVENAKNQSLLQAANQKRSVAMAVETQKAVTTGAKIDNQIELINAKKPDGKFTNVDQVKIKQLKQQKADLGIPETATPIAEGTTPQSIPANSNNPITQAIDKNYKGGKAGPEETQALDYVRSNPEKTFANYDKIVKQKFGATNVVSGDEAKYAIPGFDSTKSVSYHEPASAVAKVKYQQLLADPTTKNKPVLLMAGGSGAGKTSALKRLGINYDNYAAVVDTNSNKLESAKSKIDQALSSGRHIEVFYVHRDPVKAFKSGVIPRGTAEGRVVPIDTHIDTHYGSHAVVHKLAEDYKDDPRVELTVASNNHGHGKARPIELDEVPKMRYTREQIKPILEKEVDVAHSQNKISNQERALYRGQSNAVGESGANVQTVEQAASKTPSSQSKQERSAGSDQKVTDTTAIKSQIKDLKTDDNNYNEDGYIKPEVAKQIKGLNKQLNAGGERVAASEKPVTNVPIEESPKSTGPIDQTPGTSKIGKSIQENAVAKGLDNNFDESAKYGRIDVEDQARRAVALTKNKSVLDQVINGEKPLPEGLRATALITAIEKDPVLSKDSELLNRLSQAEHIVGQSSFSAQELRLAAERSSNSPVTAMKQVAAVRDAAIKKRLGKPVSEAVSDEVKQIRAAKPKVTKETFASFVDSLKC